MSYRFLFCPSFVSDCSENKRSSAFVRSKSQLHSTNKSSAKVEYNGLVPLDKDAIGGLLLLSDEHLSKSSRLSKKIGFTVYF